MIHHNYNYALTEFLMILFDTLIVFILIPMWVSLFSRLRKAEKAIVALTKDIEWITEIKCDWIQKENNLKTGDWIEINESLDNFFHKEFDKQFLKEKDQDDESNKVRNSYYI